MKRLIRLVAAVLLTLSATAGAAPVTAGFEDVPEGTEANVVVSEGFSFFANGGGALYYTDGAACEPACASNGTRTLLAVGTLFGFAEQVGVMREGGGTFMLASLDAAEVFSGPDSVYSATRIDYVGFLGGLAVMNGTFFLDGVVDGPGQLADFETFRIDSGAIDRFLLVGAGDNFGNNGFSLDNLRMQDVPEPGTVTLLALGLAAIGFTRRRAQRPLP